MTPPIMRKARECVGWGSGERSSHPGLGEGAELPLAGRGVIGAGFALPRVPAAGAGPVPG